MGKKVIGTAEKHDRKRHGSASGLTPGCMLMVVPYLS